MSSSSPCEELRVTKEDAWMHIEFCRPQKKNALTSAMYREAAKALEAAARDKDLRCVLFSGQGADFCAGNDLKDFLGRDTETVFAPISAFLRALVRLRCPKFAAVEGYAVGIGATLLLHCEAVFAGEQTKMKFPFTQLGLCPEACSSQLLPQRVGRLRAFELFVLGATLGASKAHDYGLVTQVCPTGEALPAARSAIERLVNTPSAALRHTMELLNRGAEPLEARLDEEFKRFVALVKEPETQARMMALLKG